MSNDTKIWSTMTKEEKTTRLFAMKAEGYTNKEIGEYYGVSEDAIKKTLQRSQKGTKRTLEEINDTPVKVEITMDTISPFLGQLLERIESLELEVASVKKLQVESASIERLDETEYKYFIYRNTELLQKFRELQEVSDYLYNEFEIRFNTDSIGRLLQTSNEWRCKGLLIKQCFKNETENMNRNLNIALNQNEDLQNQITKLKEEK